MFEVQEVDDATLAFPARTEHLMPKYEDIPDDFKCGNTKWNKIFANWFFCGIKIINAVPKKGIDKDKAMRHLRAVVGSYQPKHEHKEAAVAYLLSEWFDEFEWEPINNQMDELEKMVGEYVEKHKERWKQLT